MEDGDKTERGACFALPGASFGVEAGCFSAFCLKGILCVVVEVCEECNCCLWDTHSPHSAFEEPCFARVERFAVVNVENMEVAGVFLPHGAALFCGLFEDTARNLEGGIDSHSWEGGVLVLCDCAVFLPY